MTTINFQATITTRARYDRIAPIYDFMQQGMEKRLAPWREALWHRVRGPRVLEVGLGTGQNMRYYPLGMSLTAIDLSPRMLERARERAARLGVQVELREADVQSLPFSDASFDTVVATCVFCSVPDPFRGFQELRRVLVPGGQLLLLEHVLSRHPVAARLMSLANPVVVRLIGANINRRTVETVRRAGFVDLQVNNLWLGIFKQIEGSAPVAGPVEAKGRHDQVEEIRVLTGAPGV
jgi:ubiquinone/menaquinone biosynthesis C-methylase UbiE